jgi:hypothetical protein
MSSEQLAGRASSPAAFILVPKLGLGTPLPAMLSLASVRAKLDREDLIDFGFAAHCSLF